MDNPIYCEECGSAVGPDDMFCDCGAPVVLTSGPASTSVLSLFMTFQGDYIFCEECGAILEDRSAQFCECGAVIDWGTIDGQHDGTASLLGWSLTSASPSRDDDDLPEQPGAELDDLLDDLELARNKPLPPKPSAVVAGTFLLNQEDAVAAAVAGVAALTLHLETEPEPTPEPEPEPKQEPKQEPADIKPTDKTSPTSDFKPESAEPTLQAPASTPKSEVSKPVESTPTIAEPPKPVEPAAAPVPVKHEEPIAPAPKATPSPGGAPTNITEPTPSAAIEKAVAKEANTVACPHCHASNAAVARFCRGCGKKLGGEAPLTKEPKVEVEETMVVEKTARTEEVIVKKPSANLLAKLMSTPSTPSTPATPAPTPAPAPAPKVASVGPSPEVAAMLARAKALKAKEDEAKKAAPASTSASSAHTSEIDAMKARLAARAKQAEDDKKRKEAAEKEEHEKEMQRLRNLEDQRRADRDRAVLEIQEKRAAEEKQIEEDKQAKLAELEKQRQARAAERQQQQRETQHYESQLQAKEDQEKARANAPQLTRTPSTSQFKEVSAEELKKMTAAQRAFYFIQYERATGKPADTATATAPVSAAPKLAKIAPARNPSSGRLDSMVRTGSKSTLERVSKRKEERRSSQTTLQGTPRGASKEALLVVEPEDVRPPEKPTEEEPAAEAENEVKPRKKSTKDGDSSKKRSSKDLKEEPRRSGSRREEGSKSRAGSKKKIESSDSAKKVDETKPKKPSSKGKEEADGKKKKAEDSTRKRKSEKSATSKSSKKN